jgi:hypothetical protein
MSGTCAAGARRGGTGTTSGSGPDVDAAVPHLAWARARWARSGASGAWSKGGRPRVRMRRCQWLGRCDEAVDRKSSMERWPSVTMHGHGIGRGRGKGLYFQSYCTFYYNLADSQPHFYLPIKQKSGSSHTHIQIKKMSIPNQVVG